MGTNRYAPKLLIRESDAVVNYLCVVIVVLPNTSHGNLYKC